MRIAHVTFSFWPIRGGADAYLAELYRALDAAGHEQTVYQAAVPNSDSVGRRRSHPLPGGSETLSVEVVEWPVPGNASPGRRFWLFTLQVAAHGAELAGYDRVIAHYPSYALPILGHPGLIGLSHGVTWDCEAGQDPVSLHRSSSTGPSGKMRLRSRANRIKRFIADRAFREARSYVANDTFFLREMGLDAAPGANAWREASPQRWYLPNGVDTRRFAPEPDLSPEPVILLARNFYRNRGIHVGIEAFAQMAADRPDLTLRIVGDEGDAGYRRECEELARHLGVARRVEFAGPIPWSRMAEEYRRSAISWVPSLCGEGTSLSALESMACGTPVIASYAGGLPDLPCLHADLSPPAWAGMTAEALNHRELLARTQREAVVNGFSLERWGEAWRRVVEA